MSTGFRFSTGVTGLEHVSLSLKCRFLFNIFCKVRSCSLIFELESLKYLLIFSLEFCSLSMYSIVSLIASRADITLSMFNVYWNVSFVSEIRVSGRSSRHTACSNRLLGLSGHRSSLDLALPAKVISTEECLASLLWPCPFV